MTGIPATVPSSRPDAAAPRAAEGATAREVPALAGPPLGRDEIAPMPAEVTFGEFLSALNPLHHIPVVGWVYRQITGETIQPVFRVLGGLLMGGPIGAMASAVGALAEELIGQVDFGRSTPGATAIAAATDGSPAAVAQAPGQVQASVQAQSQPPAQAAAVASLAEASRFASLTTTAGQPLQPLPLATRLAARAYPAPSLPLRDSAPPPDPAAGIVPAAASLPAPARADRRAEHVATHDDAKTAAAPVVAPAAAPAAAPVAAPVAGPVATSGAQVRIRRAPIIPVSAGGQDPAFVQRMMDGLAAYERAMRSRTAPAAQPEAASVAP